MATQDWQAWRNEKITELLLELPEIKGSDTKGLSNWNSAASTLLVFEAMHQHCESECE